MAEGSLEAITVIILAWELGYDLAIKLATEERQADRTVIVLKHVQQDYPDDAGLKQLSVIGCPLLSVGMKFARNGEWDEYDLYRATHKALDQYNAGWFIP